jgi:hypothetical protein
MLWVIRYYKWHQARIDKVNFEAEQERLKQASNIVGHNWKRLRRQLPELYSRFALRRKAIDIEKKLAAERFKAEFERKLAEEDVQKTNDFLEETINASWKQGSDAAGKNYYYNYVTGASQWDPPDNMKTKIVDTWIKNIDVRGNVYYYNMQTGESSWLPPCSVCGVEVHSSRKIILTLIYIIIPTFIWSIIRRSVGVQTARWPIVLTISSLYILATICPIQLLPTTYGACASMKKKF